MQEKDLLQRAFAVTSFRKISSYSISCRSFWPDTSKSTSAVAIFLCCHPCVAFPAGKDAAAVVLAVEAVFVGKFDGTLVAAPFLEI